MYRLVVLTICAGSIVSASWAQTTMAPSGSMPPPPPSLNGQPPALEAPLQPTPIPQPAAPQAAVDDRAGTVFDCDRLARLGQTLPLDCRSGARGK